MVTILGLVAACLTTGAYIPQVIKTWRTKATDDLSFGMYAMMSGGILLWLVYGIINRDIPIIFANSIAIVFTFIILYFKIAELRRAALRKRTESARKPLS